MKKSISVKSWKFTISLSTLLFLILAVTVLSLPITGISMPSSSSSPASPANGSITYDVSSNTITVVGGPYGFMDIYKADVAGGWGVTHLQSTNQFYINAHINVGDGNTQTTFSDTSKEVTIGDIFTNSPARWMTVYDKATVTFGACSDTTNKYTSQGCTFMAPVVSNWGFMFLTTFGGSNTFLYLYSCDLKSQAGIDCDVYSPNRLWNCHVSQYISVMSQGYSDIANVIMDSAGSMVIYTSPVEMSNVQITNTLIFVRFGNAGTSPAFVSNLYGRNASLASFYTFTTGTVGNVINANVDAWTFLWGTSGTIYRQYTFDLTVTDRNNNAISGATVILKDKNGNTVFNVNTNASGAIATQTVSRGYYNQANGNTLQDYSPHTLTISQPGYQTYTSNFTLSQKTNWTIALQPLTDSGLIEHVGLVPVDPGLTSPNGTYRWLDVADQAYSIGYQNSYNYSQAAVEVAYCAEGNELQGLLQARNLKPNFAYQLKLVGIPSTAENELIGLAGRWWQEEWNGTAWVNGQNLNDKGDGSSPNPNDQTYFSRRYIQDSSSPTGYHYRYTGYLVFDYFITDSNGSATLQFETGSCYHVLWKTTQRGNTTGDGPVETVTFDPDPSQPAYGTDYPSNTVSIFGEWERLPMGQVNLQPGEYNCQIVLTEESFHGSGGTLAGNWAGAVTANIMFTIN